MSDAPRHSNSSPAKNLRRRIVRWFNRGRDKSAACAPLPASGIHRILICRATKTLGETLLLTPLLGEIERRFPGAEVDVLTRCTAAPGLFAGWFNVGRVQLLPGRLFAAPLAMTRLLRGLRAARYDLAIDPYLFSNTDRVLVARSQARYSIGLDSERKSGCLTHAVAAPKTLEHAGKLPVFALRSALGADDADYPLLDLRLSATERAAGAQVLANLAGGARRTIGVYAHATGVKSFARAWWDEFLPALAARFPEHAIVEILPATGGSLLGDRYPAFYAGDARKLGALLANLDLFVSADCGVMHLASASGAPTAGMFIASDIEGWNVYGRGRWSFDARGRTPAQMAAEVVSAASAG
ncbi:MAG TPA: glycosyltransferase family 9 protein [Rudaea sp.]|nr:glycosyltransferase family 9 protein [Rudaea sp.]